MYFVFLLLCIHYVKGINLIQRPGYGVVFTKNSEVVDGGGILIFRNTWAIEIPDYKLVPLKYPSCLNNSYFIEVCQSLNDLISEANLNVYNMIASSKRLLFKALNMIPQSDKRDLGRPLAGWSRRRKKREAEPTVPSYLKSSKVEDLLDYMPSRVMGQFFSNIFSIPAADSIQGMKTAVRFINKGIYDNSGKIYKLQSDFSSVVCASNGRQHQLEKMQTENLKSLDSLIKAIKILSRNTEDALNNISQGIEIMNKMKEKLVAEVIPVIYSYNLVAQDTTRFFDSFTKGLLDLTAGRISKTIISETMINKVLTFITSDLLSGTFYDDLTLISKSPSYYYKIDNIAFARTDKHIMITMNFPLINFGGQMPLYKIDVFPVGLTSGMHLHKERQGFTKILGLPDFIAISKNKEYFIELSLPQYMSCKGSVLKSCGSSVAVVTEKKNPTCAYAIFLDNHNLIRQLCEIGYSKTGPKGSAIQLTNDDTFVVYSGEDSTDWVMTCDSDQNNLQHVIPCSYCQIKIPCGCSLTAQHFIVPKRINGCEYSTSQNITKINFRNTAMLTHFLDNQDLINVRSFDRKLGSLFPTIHLPKINFSYVSNFRNWIEKSQEYKLNYTKIAEKVKMGREIYEDKMDLALAEAKDFTHIQVDRAPDVAKAFGHLFSMFGSLGKLLSFLTAPQVLGILAFCIMAFVFFPRFVPDMMAYYKVHKNRRQYNRLSSKDAFYKL